MRSQTTMALALSALLTTAVSIAKADTLKLFSDRGDFAGDDTADWGQLGACQTTIPNTFAATSDVAGLGITGNFSEPGVGQVRMQSVCWGGNFAPGDSLIWTNTPGQGPLTLSFDLPQAGAGAQIQAYFYDSFTAQVEAFDSDGTSLGSFTEDGVSGPESDNSAIFIGLKDLDGPNVASIVFSLTSAFRDPASFAINKLALDSGATIPKPNGVGPTASGQTSDARTIQTQAPRRLLPGGSVR